VNFRVAAAVLGADLPRGLVYLLAPLVLGALTDDRDFDERTAAWLTSVELLAAAAAAIIAASWLGRRSRRETAVLGVALFASAQLLSMLRLGLLPLLLLRILVGVGAGLASAAAVAAASGARDPERVFAVSSLAGGAFFVAIYVPIGYAVASAGASGVFASAAVCALLGFMLLRPLPAPQPVAGSAEIAGAQVNVGPALLVVSAFTAYSVGTNAIFAFSERIGRDIGIPVEGIAGVLAISTLAGLGGPLAVAVLGTSLGRSAPLLFAIAGTAICGIAIVLAQTPLVYTVAQGAWGFIYFLSLPYFMGTLSALDARGRWAVIGTGLAAAGGALGPGVASILVGNGSYRPVASLLLACVLFSIAAIVPVLIRLDRGTIIAAPPLSDETGERPSGHRGR